MPAQEKTESATPKRRQDVRKKGQVARSQEVGTAISLLIAWFAFRTFGGSAIDSMAELFTNNFQNIKQPDFSMTGLASMGLTNVMVFGKVMVPIAGGLVLAGLIANVLQVGSSRHGRWASWSSRYSSWSSSASLPIGSSTTTWFSSRSSPAATFAEAWPSWRISASSCC
jgi:hypothetical protein